MNLVRRGGGPARCLVVDRWQERGIFHGFGDASYDLRSSDQVAEFGAAFDVAATRLHLLKQEHGKKVAEVRTVEDVASLEGTSADAWVVDLNSAPGHAFGILTADCVPVLVTSRQGNFAAAVHCGWRGASAGLLLEVLVRLGRLGAPAKTLEVAIGPGAQSCCYQIQEDVRSALLMAFEFVNFPFSTNVPDPVTERGGALYASIRDLLTAQSIFAGVPRAQIAISETCTICSEEYFSFRRQKDAAGRQVSFIGKAG